MVFQPKKHDPTKLRICVNFRELNKVTLTYPFPTPYANEILNEVVGHISFEKLKSGRRLWQQQKPKHQSG